MSRVIIQGLSKQFSSKPPTKAVDDLHLEIEEGEFLVLLGPSGCGKTTTLRCLAGLEEPDEGRIAFGNQSVFDSNIKIDVPPDKRSIGMVFQSYALWPHMTVRQNIEYPLRVRKHREALAEDWAGKMATLVQCEALLDRYPAQLSGGQQQRVSLARALVGRPGLVLFDEPLSNLDAKLRHHVRSFLHELHTQLRFTAVFVTHDQSEALALGDRLAIMRSGKIEQLDTPRSIFERPITEYVADFIGMNNRIVLESAGGDWACNGAPVIGTLPGLHRHEWVAVRLRPEDLQVGVSKERTGEDRIGLAATIIDATFAGRHFDLVVSVGGSRFLARVSSDSSDAASGCLMAGAATTVWFQRQDAVFYSRTGEAIVLGEQTASAARLVDTT